MADRCPEITRHFINVDERRVHFARCGDGSPVVMLHASPRSAYSMRTAQSVFGARFLALAFDTPSFGLSDPISLQAPEIEDFAVALAKALSELGIEQISIYGRHTGAAIAVEFARAFPERCSMGMTDGFPVYTASERADRLEHYIPPMEPSWEGAHLLWTWFRFRDQFVFWPWHRQTADTRSDSDITDPIATHRGVLDMLDAGDGVMKAYGAAFRYRGLNVLEELVTPVCFGNRPGDMQYHTMSRYPPNAWTIELPRDPLSAALAERRILEQCPATQHVGRLPAPALLRTRTTLDYVTANGRQLLTRRAGGMKGPPVVIVHPLPGSTALCDELVLSLGQKVPALAIDLPGQGQSDALDDDVSIPVWTKSLQEALTELGIAECHMLGVGTGATVAVEYTRLYPKSVVSLILRSPPGLDPSEREYLAPRYSPAADIAWEGGHLTRIFHHIRDQELWWPWFDRRPETKRVGGHRIDPSDLTRRTVEALRHPTNYAPAWRSVLSYPLRENLARLDLPVHLFGTEADLFFFHLDRFNGIRAERFGSASDAELAVEIVARLNRGL